MAGEVLGGRRRLLKVSSPFASVRGLGHRCNTFLNKKKIKINRGGGSASLRPSGSALAGPAPGRGQRVRLVPRARTHVGRGSPGRVRPGRGCSRGPRAGPAPGGAALAHGPTESPESLGRSGRGVGWGGRREAEPSGPASRRPSRVSSEAGDRAPDHRERQSSVWSGCPGLLAPAPAAGALAGPNQPHPAPSSRGLLRRGAPTRDPAGRGAQGARGASSRPKPPPQAGCPAGMGQLGTPRAREKDAGHTPGFFPYV